MLLIRTMKQIRTSSTIPSFRACQTLSRLDLSQSDRARAIGATSKMLASEARRQWLMKQWQGKAASVPPQQRLQVKPKGSNSQTMETTPVNSI